MDFRYNGVTTVMFVHCKWALTLITTYLPPSICSSVDGWDLEEVEAEGCGVPVIESYSQYLHVYSLTGLSQ